MTFKAKLVEHFKQFDASPILFIGSGMSRRYLGISCWEDLLNQFAIGISENPLKLKTQANGDLPAYGKLLADVYAEKWWDTKDANKIQAEEPELFIDAASPLKVSISKFIGKIHEKMELGADLNEEIELLKNANVDGIITTNWDLLIESLFPKFTPFIGQDGLITGRSHGIAEIYKIHGCSSEPNSLVLTSTDYDRYRRKNPYLSSKLLTMFIERPVIFLGYSLTDAHIAEILEDIVSCFPKASLDFLKNKLLFIEWKPEVTEPELTDSVIHKKIPVKYVQTASYKDIFAVLSETKKRIPAHLFRTIKDELYELVLTDDPKGKLYVRDAERVEDDRQSTEFVVGYGAISMVKKSESLPQQGLVGLERWDVIREVVFENGHYECKDIVSDVFPKLCKSNTRVPLFYYLNRAGYLDDKGILNQDIKLCEGAGIRFDIQIEGFQSKGGDSRRAESVPELKEGVNALYSAHDFGLFLRMMPYMAVDLLYRDLDDLLKILKKHIDEESKSINSSGFSKLVCVYDFVKFSNRFGLS